MYLDTISVYLVPKEVENKKLTADRLGEAVSIDPDTLLKRIDKDNYFAWVKRKVDEDTKNKVESLGLEGVYFMKEPKRFYPGETLACHILGVTGIDNEGLEGVEFYYDRDLKGEYGWKRSYRDAKRREIVSFQTEVLPARNGNNLVLTVDEVIQHILEREVRDIVKRYKPEAVSIIALEPSTGEVLGIANYPFYNGNEIRTIDGKTLRNRAISDSFEPGSVFKVVTASAALEEGVVDFDTKFFCENGQYRIGKRILHDYKPYGNLTFRQVIEKSSNIGVSKVASKLGKEKLYEYVIKFNCGNPTGIDLPGEAGGIVRDLDKWFKVDMTTIPMGQGIALTTLQLASIVSAIANEGVLMKPFVVKEVLNEEGIVIKENHPFRIRQVISLDTANKVKELLKGVVDHGTGKRAKLDRYTACGKTGTAQKVKPGGYYKKKYIASFIGFAPSENPKIALAISVDDPKGRRHFGGQVAAPAFRNIMNNALPYLENEDINSDLQEVI